MSDLTLSLARELIRKHSVTPDDGGCQELLATRLSTLGFSTEHLKFGQVSNLWARKGSEAPLLVFAGHTDVVPTGPPAAWKFDPFSATIEGGNLYGRGAVDMKSSLAAFVTGIERFLETSPDFRGSIGLLITSDEEGPAVDGTARVLDKLSERGERIDYCVVGEPSSGAVLGDTIKNGRRGSLSGLLRVFGIQGHVAYPETADNPIHRCVPALQNLSTMLWDEGDAHFPPTTFQVSSIRAGTGDAENVIPGELEMKFNLRFGTASTPESLKQRLEAVLHKHGLNFEIEWRLQGLPFLTPEGQLIVATIRAVESILGLTPLLSTAGGTSDGRFIAPTGAQVVELGPINETIHKINECIDIEDPDRLSRVYCRILDELLGNP